MWALGQKKWSERCEDHELRVGPCDANTHDAMLHAVIRGSQFRGGFLTLEHWARSSRRGSWAPEDLGQAMHGFLRSITKL